MNIQDYFNQIESIGFAVNYDIFSGFGLFHRALADDGILAEFVEDMNQHPETKLALFKRLTDVVSENNQPEYAHPHDVAIAAYLYALSRVDTQLTQTAIKLVQQTPQLWWAKRLAKYLAEKLPEEIAE